MKIKTHQLFPCSVFPCYIVLTSVPFNSKVALWGQLQGRVFSLYIRIGETKAQGVHFTLDLRS